MQNNLLRHKLVKNEVIFSLYILALWLKQKNQVPINVHILKHNQVGI